MKTLLLLNSSMVVKKPYFSRDYIKIEYGNKRINSYVDGFINLQKLEIYKMFDETILIDNTISSAKNVPDQIIKLLPKKTEGDKKETSISMYPWMPLAEEKEIPLPTDWVVTMVTPIKKVEQMYTEDVLNGKPTNKTDSVDKSAKVGFAD